jgi:hypothetical protein
MCWNGTGSWSRSSVFEPALTDLQRQVLALLGVPELRFRLG